MTEPTGGTPPLPPEVPPAPAPEPPAAAPAPASSWDTPVPPITAPATPAALQGATVEAGPAPGVSYAGLGVRLVAYFIDGLIYGVALVILSVITIGIFGALGGTIGLILGLVVLIGLSLFGSLAYFVYFWTTARATLGQRLLGLETVNAADGATLTRDQAIKRWIWLQGVFVIASAAQQVLAGSSLSFLSSLLSLAAFAYIIFLLYTTNKSSKRQGYHDVQAGTVVVTRKKA